MQVEISTQDIYIDMENFPKYGLLVDSPADKTTGELKCIVSITGAIANVRFINQKR